VRSLLDKAYEESQKTFSMTEWDFRELHDFNIDIKPDGSMYIVRTPEWHCTNSRSCNLWIVNLNNTASGYWAGELFVMYSQCVPCWIRLVKRARRLLHERF
jgi:hypothetical protein